MDTTCALKTPISSTPLYVVAYNQSILHALTDEQTGWMMWNAMVPALTVGTRLLAYDGSPFYPDVRSFLKMISDQGCVCTITLLYSA